jgi:hypothetical protein
MPKMPIPLEITKFVAVDPSEREPGDTGVVVLVETVGGEMALKMPVEVAEAIYHGVYEKTRGN